MEFLFGIIIFAISIAVGTSLPLWVGIIPVLYLGYITTKTDGLGAIVPMVLMIIVFVGLVIGNISYLVQTDYFKDINISNPFVVEKKESLR